MPTVEQVERKILAVERLRVRIVHPATGKNVRGDLDGLPRYSFKKALGDPRRISEWKRLRFDPLYPKYEVEVLNSLGRGAQPVSRKTTLRTVRNTYADQ
jgi:hypothetical protein